MKTVWILTALVATQSIASAQVRQLGNLPVQGRVQPASHCSQCAGSGYAGPAYVGESYGAPACGGCNSCRLCSPCATVVCGAVGLVGELLCDVKTVVDVGVSRVVGCLLPCRTCCAVPACGVSGCSDCSAGYASGYGAAGCSSCGVDANLMPMSSQPTPAPAASAPQDPFEDDPISHAQSTVRRQYVQQALPASDGRTVRRATHQAPSTSRAAASRYQPQHNSQLRRLSNTGRMSATRPSPTGAYR